MKLTAKGKVTLAGLGRLRAKHDAKINFGGASKEKVSGFDVIEGHREGEIEPVSIDVTVLHSAGIKLKELLAFEGDVEFETDTGTVYKVFGCIVKSGSELSEGDLSITLEGDDWDEV